MGDPRAPIRELGLGACPLRGAATRSIPGMGRGDDSFERRAGRTAKIESRAGVRRPGLPPAGGVRPQRPAAGPGGPGPRQAGTRGRPGRAGRDGLPGRAADRAARRCPRGPGLRPPRHAARRGPEAALHRPDRAARRAPRLAAHRLAGAGGRGVLPGDRRRAPSASYAAGCCARPGPRVVGVEDELLDSEALAELEADGVELPDRRRGRADGPAVAGPRPHDALHRRDHPGRAGPGDPRPQPRRRLDQRWPGHRQDRGRAAPRGLPALHRPAPLRDRRRAGGRPERRLHALHRAGAAQPR